MNEYEDEWIEHINCSFMIGSIPLIFGLKASITVSAVSLRWEQGKVWSRPCQQDDHHMFLIFYILYSPTAKIWEYQNVLEDLAHQRWLKLTSFSNQDGCVYWLQPDHIDPCWGCILQYSRDGMLPDLLYCNWVRHYNIIHTRTGSTSQPHSPERTSPLQSWNTFKLFNKNQLFWQVLKSKVLGSCL